MASRSSDLLCEVLCLRSGLIRFSSSRTDGLRSLCAMSVSTARTHLRILRSGFSYGVSASSFFCRRGRTDSR